MPAKKIDVRFYITLYPNRKPATSVPNSQEPTATSFPVSEVTQCLPSRIS